MPASTAPGHRPATTSSATSTSPPRSCTGRTQSGVVAASMPNARSDEAGSLTISKAEVSRVSGSARMNGSHVATATPAATRGRRHVPGPRGRAQSGTNTTAHGLAAAATVRSTMAAVGCVRRTATSAAAIAASAIASSRWAVRTAMSPHTTTSTMPATHSHPVAPAPAGRSTPRAAASTNRTTARPRSELATMTATSPASVPSSVNGRATRMLNGPNWSSGWSP